MMLRIQKERIGSPLFPNTREYSRYFGLNQVRLDLDRVLRVIAGVADDLGELALLVGRLLLEDD